MTSQHGTRKRDPEKRAANRTAIVVACIGGGLGLVGTLGAAYIQVHFNHLQAQVHTQISQQNQKISTLRTSSSPVPAAPTGGNYLSDTTPVTDLDNAASGPVVINGVRYTDSITFSCSGNVGDSVPPLAYPVAGSTFTAVVGVQDATSGTQNVQETVSFTNQNGNLVGDRVTVSAGHPLKVTQSISGVTQLHMSCTAVDTTNGQRPEITPTVSLGNAATP